MQTSKNYKSQFERALASGRREHKRVAGRFSLIQMLRDINHGSDLAQDCPNY